jgi:hypothetical protein
VGTVAEARYREETGFEIDAVTTLPDGGGRATADDASPG